jgi:catechol 2,3-dioxygenase-like lactoylglutathione lyase family enzyme
MEAIIARLLDGFVQGKISRRKLIQSLTVATAGGHVLGTPTVAAAAPTAVDAVLPPTTSIDHMAYTVLDYGRSRDFYSDLLGWEVTGDDPERGEARLRMGSVGDIIIRNSRTPDDPNSTGVLGHICWGLDTYDTDAVREELASRGLNPRRDQGGNYDAFDSYMVRDPDGWDVQLSVNLRD